MDNQIKTQYHILLVDDEPLIRESLYEILRIEGYQVTLAATAEEALEILNSQSFEVVLTDYKLPKISGIELLERIKANDDHQDTEVIVLTGFGSIEMAVEAMKKGAYDYITKPINDSEIKNLLEKIIEKFELLNENLQLKKTLASHHKNSFCGMIGASSEMQKVYHIIESVATSNATILINGESGTGKGMAARAIHESDAQRSSKPFVEVSCGALSETLLESELFGHVKGAFTGAIKDKEGRFEYARGGTIFLDEIDAFSMALQVKLLRVLQDNVFERVGDNVTRKTDARIIVATNKSLPDLVKEGTFREDLYYRINVINIMMPPLRDRKQDIDAIIDFYIKKYSQANGKTVEALTDDVRSLLRHYNWPGNIRELENAVEGAVIMSSSPTISRNDIPNIDKFLTSTAIATDDAMDQTLKKVVEQPEKEHIIQVLESCHWNRNKAAAALGVNRTTLYNKMKKYNISDKLD